MAGHEIEDMNINFKESFIKSIGDGSSTLFWDETWVGGEKLKLLFPRLYRLEAKKDVLLCDQVNMKSKTLMFNWEWLRAPYGRTKVEKLTGLIEEKAFEINNLNCETMRNNFVPKKLEVFVWRAVQGRIPVRVELDNRGIDLHSVRCPMCDDDLETASHSLVFCKEAMEVWDKVFAWWGFGNMSNLSLNEICRSNCPSSTSNFGKKLWQAVEWVCSYLIWKNRNNMIFREKKWVSSVGLNEIQIKSFEWISKRSKGRRLDWLTWLNDPSMYLRLV
ncbi:uncharacterized protein [Rutidosis leptorrhynchoides]|uniref:uncharacterized protein n=1 Tax=Rutidosis leptorrhynchoides TaxID=125765 RepID=UPI003A9A02A0